MCLTRKSPSPPFIACTKSDTVSVTIARPVEVVNLRLRMTAPGESYTPPFQEPVPGDGSAARYAERPCALRRGFMPTPHYARQKLVPGDCFHGPAMITEYTSATVLPPGWRARVDGYSNLVTGKASMSDPIRDLSIFQSAVHSIAEEMGAALRRTALSPNIKERRDYSCAVFDGQARVIAMGDHMPVHLGSMPMSVEAAVSAIAFAPGDIVILNDPYAGGTHLPDITMVLPVFLPAQRAAVLLCRQPRPSCRCRRHVRGSMGPANEIFQEGLRIPPVRIARGEKLDRECSI